VPESVSAGDSTAAATEALCRRVRDRGDKGRLLAARALRQRLGQPVVAQLMEALRAEAADNEGAEEAVASAIETLAEARDPEAVPLLLDRLGRGPAAVTAAAQAALCALCATDLGTSRRRWASWARKHLARPRVEWLLEGLGHKQPEIRMAAAEELRQLAGDSFGYLFDLPKREREQARKRFVAWWLGLSPSK
jgi:HEAT repeat protein